MSPITISGPGLGQTGSAGPDALAEFDLDVQVTADAAIGYTVRRCDSSDNCGSTCASACASD
jgi:FxLD family lantipeptide